MASLENASIASSYTSLLKLNGNTDNLVAGASGDAIQIVDGNGTGSSLYLNTDRIGIGIDSPSTNLHVSKETDITNTTTDVMRLSHTTTGSSAVGFGAVLRFDGERTGSTTDQMGNIGFVADAVSSSTINGAFVVNTAIDGSPTESLRIGSSGSSTFVGDITTSKANATGNSIILQQSLGSLASPSTSADTNILGKIQFVGKSTNDTPVGAEIKSVLTGSVGSAKNMPSSLVFSTQPVGGADLTTALTLAADRSATFAGEVIAHSGVNFPDDASTNPSSDVNTLDSYEEGTWTPTYGCSSGSFNTLTMDVISANYTKIGRQVTVTADIQTDSVNLTGASGTLRIAGLPFTADKDAPMLVGQAYNWVSNNFPSTGRLLDNTTEILLIQRDTSNGATGSMVPADLTAGATADQNGIQMMVTYFV